MRRLTKTNPRPVALVTGGGRRLGRQIAYALGANGYDVVINYLHSKNESYEAVRRLKLQHCNSIAIRADVSKRTQVGSMVGKVIERFGQIDLLVNNAAIFVNSPLEKTTDSIWKKTLDTNLRGVFLCSQIVSRHMLRRRSGKIINIASLGGLQAWHRHIPYSVSKAGVIMLTRCLAKALAPHVTVNAIAPGTIIVPGEEDSRSERTPVEKILLRRYGNPRDITDLVVFLATTSQYITGQIISVDGGRYI